LGGKSLPYRRTARSGGVGQRDLLQEERHRLRPGAIPRGLRVHLQARGFDKLRATKGKNWQELIDFGQAFLPPNSLVETTIMSSSEGRYGSVYMVTAIGPVHLTEPKLKRAIEAITRANPLGVAGQVSWRSSDSIGDYSVDFYGRSFPESNVGGGPRECMGVVRYIHGTPPSHPQRVIGTYCEIGKIPLDSKRAAAVLDTLLVRPELVQ
jgi:hypothetical protein